MNIRSRINIRPRWLVVSSHPDGTWVYCGEYIDEVAAREAYRREAGRQHLGRVASLYRLVPELVETTATEEAR